LRSRGLETVSYFVLISTCLLVSGGWIYDRFLPARRQQAESSSMEAQFINKKIVASAPSQLTKRNVLLFVRPDEVKLSDFARLGVVATPTILLTDQTGVVRRAWIGTLEDPRTRDFLNAISE
jgi:hypothetical protein